MTEKPESRNYEADAPLAMHPRTANAIAGLLEQEANRRLDLPWSQDDRGGTDS